MAKQFDPKALVAAGIQAQAVDRAAEPSDKLAEGLRRRCLLLADDGLTFAALTKDPAKIAAAIGAVQKALEVHATGRTVEYSAPPIFRVEFSDGSNLEVRAEPSEAGVEADAASEVGS